MPYLVELERLESPVVALRVVDAEGGQQLEHLLLHLDVGRVQGWKNVRSLEEVVDIVVKYMFKKYILNLKYYIVSKVQKTCLNFL